MISFLQKAKATLQPLLKDSPPSNQGGFMSQRHKYHRIFSKKTKERLELYALLLNILLTLILIGNSFRA